MNLQMLHKAPYIPEDRCSPSSLFPYPSTPLILILILAFALGGRPDITPTQRPASALGFARTEHTPETAVLATALLRGVQLCGGFDVNVAFCEEGPFIQYSSTNTLPWFGIEGFEGFAPLAMCRGGRRGRNAGPLKGTFLASPVGNHAGDADGAVIDTEGLFLEADEEAKGTFAEAEGVLVGREGERGGLLAGGGGHGGADVGGGVG